MSLARLSPRGRTPYKECARRAGHPDRRLLADAGRFIHLEHLSVIGAQYNRFFVCVVVARTLRHSKRPPSAGAARTRCDGGGRLRGPPALPLFGPPTSFGRTQGCAGADMPHRL
ncbi:hypothetical protein EVAR_47274_1 [Eumeta japonica]|uniref:Uncharacterized protein n=1 Tax=Eumeta variegata TaxID=151549 RepID=A0A4C1XJB3_EUMVA|nr:hypothetical protein EVAR_47274_1 [Eumeta japonica]